VEAGYHNAIWATKDPDLEILHDDPEFQKLVKLDRFKTLNTANS
jgi:hypothetical protein